MIKHHALFGDHIARVAEEMVRKAVRFSDTVESDLNGITICATPTSTVDDVVSMYDEERARRDRARGS